MSYLAYKTLHVFAALGLFLAMGGLVLRALDAGTDKTPARRLAAITHGAALVLLLVSGFGLMARLGIAHDWVFPAWIWGKLVLWLAFGGVLALLHRRPGLLRPLWFLLPLLGGLAAGLAIYKP